MTPKFSLEYLNKNEIYHWNILFHRKICYCFELPKLTFRFHIITKLTKNEKNSCDYDVYFNNLLTSFENIQSLFIQSMIFSAFLFHLPDDTFYWTFAWRNINYRNELSFYWVLTDRSVYSIFKEYLIGVTVNFCVIFQSLCITGTTIFWMLEFIWLTRINRFINIALVLRRKSNNIFFPTIEWENVLKNDKNICLLLTIPLFNWTSFCMDYHML